MVTQVGGSRTVLGVQMLFVEILGLLSEFQFHK